MLQRASVSPESSPSCRSPMLTYALFLALTTSLVGNVQAQGLYRCGNVYQDTPCASANGKKLSGGATTTANKPTVLNNARVVPDSGCTLRGQEAQKINWAREGGMSEEQMLAKARTDTDKKMVQDVYRMRGTNGEIKSAIETSCME